jgi:isochorismate hydrolase
LGGNFSLAFSPDSASSIRATWLIFQDLTPFLFTETKLEEWLKGNGINTLTICGYMTQMCCDTTARRAFHLGYAVEFLSDATGTLSFENEAGAVTDEELHRATLVTQNRFSKVMKTNEWVSCVRGITWDTLGATGGKKGGI